MKQGLSNGHGSRSRGSGAAAGEEPRVTEVKQKKTHTQEEKRLPKGLGRERGCQTPPSVRHINVRARLPREQET